jgi:hypothetical protein
MIERDANEDAAHAAGLLGQRQPAALDPGQAERRENGTNLK